MSICLYVRFWGSRFRRGPFFLLAYPQRELFAQFRYHLVIEYVRDKRSPKPKNEAVSRVMSANRAKNTSPEIKLRKALWGHGLRGYRLHPKGIPGRPDIAFSKSKLAIFVNGCFWHRCARCMDRLPSTNTDFWKAKFQRNVDRDLRKAQQLRRLGWRVNFVWECDLKSDVGKVVAKIDRRLNSA
jgi:DNA mismatch endonuclease, patch repair protein